MGAEYLFLLFVIGSVLGFGIETVFCYCVRRRLENRRGLLYGPFSQIYGFGALLMTVFLSPLAKEGFVVLFLCSALLGGLFEALCSVLQESAFGAISWNYEKQLGSLLGGRTSLGFMFFWGLLGSLYITLLHPRLFMAITALPARGRQLCSLFLFLFLAVDLLLSCFALRRWQERQGNKITQGRFWAFFDQHFPDGRMEETYSGMIFLKKTEEAS